MFDLKKRNNADFLMYIVFFYGKMFALNYFLLLLPPVRVK